MRLYSRIDGPEGGMPLVLINGLFAASTSWDAVMPSFADCRVLRYDGRGQGRSDQPSGVYDLDTLLDDLEALLQQLHWPPSFFLGISNGGCVALGLAARNPGRVLGVVAADCNDRVSPLLRLKINSWIRAHEVGGPEHRFDVATPWIWGEAVLTANPELVEYYRKKACQLDSNAVLGLLQGALTHHIDLERIQAPTLYMVGEEDLLTPPFSMRAMCRQTKGSTLKIVPGGHACLLEQPNLVGDIALPFMAEVHRVG